MKNLFLLLVLTAYSLGTWANNPSKINQVIVYQQGAKITSEANVKLLAGNNEIIISNLPVGMDPNSIQVKVSGSAILLSASVRTRLLENKELPIRTKQIEDSIIAIDNEVLWLKSEKAVYEGEEKIILANQKLGNEQQKMQVEELVKLSEFFRTRLLDIHQKNFNIDKKVDQLMLMRLLLSQKLDELRNSEKKSVGELVINISSKEAVSQKLFFNYLIYDAGWTPLYDVRAEGTNKPMQLIYKANVYQSSGIDWSGVQLTISTGNPTASKDRPVLYPWFIDFVHAWNYSDEYSADKRSVAAQNLYQGAMPAEVVSEDVEESAPVPYLVQETNNRMSAEYRIDIAQDIPSDGNNHLVAIQAYELNSNYVYHAVPKLDPGAFLLAKVADYGKFNLLPGPSNLFLEGMYMGQSYLNPVTTVDSMLLSLGQDDKISIKRTQLQDFTSKQQIAGTIKESRGFEISVRNNNTFAIDIEVLDQMPISKSKEIEVKAEDIGGAIYDSNYGSVLWKLNLKPGETKIIRFAYSVKYPKDKNIDIL